MSYLQIIKIRGMGKLTTDVIRAQYGRVHLAIIRIKISTKSFHKMKYVSLALITVIQGDNYWKSIPQMK